MEDTESKQKEPVVGSVIEEIIQINIAALGAGAVFCQVCGGRVREGGRVSAYAFRRCCESRWVVGQARCPSHPLAFSSLATLGVCELVVEGRVGRCVDQAVQANWQVFLALEVSAVSPRLSRETVAVSNTDTRTEWPEQCSPQYCPVCAVPAETADAMTTEGR